MSPRSISERDTMILVRASLSLRNHFNEKYKHFAKNFDGDWTYSTERGFEQSFQTSTVNSIIPYRSLTMLWPIRRLLNAWWPCEWFGAIISCTHRIAVEAGRDCSKPWFHSISHRWSLVSIYRCCAIISLALRLLSHQQFHLRFVSVTKSITRNAGNLPLCCISWLLPPTNVRTLANRISQYNVNQNQLLNAMWLLTCLELANNFGHLFIVFGAQNLHQNHCVYALFIIECCMQLHA